MARIDEAMVAGRNANRDDQLCKEIGAVLQLILFDNLDVMFAATK